MIAKPGGKRDARRAVSLYKKGALLGDLQSQTNLAVWLLDGDGVRADIEAGLHWLRRAARRGDSKAQYNLGIAYADGDNVRLSATYAKKWLTRAAENGHARARRWLVPLFFHSEINRSGKSSPGKRNIPMP